MNNDVIQQDVLNDDNNILGAIVQNVRSYRRGRDYVYTDLFHLQRALRMQRKTLLGTGIPYSRFIYKDGDPMYDGIAELAENLAQHTMTFWNQPYEDGLRFCRVFYELCLSGPEWMLLDDIILLATTLVHSQRSIFIDVMTQLIPKRFHNVLNTFLNEYPGHFYAASFEDAVLGGICVFLGLLPKKDEEE